MKRLAGILLVVGAVIFIGAAFLYAPTGFFDAATDEERIAIVHEWRTLMAVASNLMAVGAITAASGLASLARRLGQQDESRLFTILRNVCAAIALIGAFTWVITGAMSIILSPERNAELSAVGGVMFVISSSGSLGSVLLLGIILFVRGRRWLGGFLTVMMVLSLVTGAWFIPLTSYIPMIIAGIWLLIRPIGGEPAPPQGVGLQPASVG